MIEINKILSEYLDHKFNFRESDFWDREIGRYHDTSHVEEIEEREAKDGERWSEIVDGFLEELKQ